MINIVLKSVTLALAVVGLQSVAYANDHKFPDITGYEKPFIMHQRLASATTSFMKMVDSSGKRDDIGLSIERSTIGVMRERYDNKYAYFGVFTATGDGDKKSLITGNEAELKDQVGLVYGNGIHLSDLVDWSMYLEVASGKMTADDDSKNGIGAGIGSELNVGLGRYVDIGLVFHVSVHYTGTGINVKLNF